MLIKLQERGVLAKMADRIKVRRQSGYYGFELWLFLIIYYPSDTHCGVKTFWRHLKPYQQQLATLVDRISLASPSALGRGLAAVENKLLRDYGDDLLTNVADINSLLRNPAVHSYDANGEPWHLFDLDPTVTTLQHRALPIDEALPEPMRDSQNTGVAGYGGHILVRETRSLIACRCCCIRK